MQTVTASVLAVHWLPKDLCIEVPQYDYEVMPGARIYISSDLERPIFLGETRSEHAVAVVAAVVDVVAMLTTPVVHTVP